MEQKSAPILATTSTNVFQNGIFSCEQFNVNHSSCPKPLLISTPTVAGTYPVIVFNHGFAIHNNYYSHLFAHITSHGFIVVAPELLDFDFVPLPGPTEVELAGKVVDWLADGLQAQFEEKFPNIRANLDTLILAGHSRGGKTAFAVALGYAHNKHNKYSALIGVDPVAGTSSCKACRTEPHILTYEPQSFNLNMPVAVIGTGLGPDYNFISPPCAPDLVNHKEFFDECKPPCAHFVTTDYGHMDMLDDDDSIEEVLLKCMCKSGTGPKDIMRNTVSGLIVAFLKAQLYGHSKDLNAILADPSVAPTKLDPVKYVPA